MDIAAFSANVNAFNGLQSPARFRVRVFPKYQADTQFLEFLCENVNLPGSTIATAQSRPLGYGALFSAPLTTVYDPVTMNFLMDNSAYVLGAMTDWQLRVVNHDYAPGGALDNSQGTMPFQVGYVDDYAAEVEISTFTQSADEVTVYTLHDAWPQSVGSVQLSWSAKDQVAVLPVTLAYRSWTSTQMSVEDL